MLYISILICFVAVVTVQVTSEVKSRLINAKPFKETKTTKFHPWVAYVQLTTRLQENHKPPNVAELTSSCGGAIRCKTGIGTTFLVAYVRLTICLRENIKPPKVAKLTTN